MPVHPSDTSNPDPESVRVDASSGSASPGVPVAGHWPEFGFEALRRAQAGDEQALGSFFEHYFDKIFAVVLRYVGNREIAEDLTQNIFLKVRRHISRLDVERDPAPWLYTVAINTCRDHHRSGWWRLWRNRVRIDSAHEAPELVSGQGDPEQVLAAARSEVRVQSAVQRLPGDLRISVILHDFEGMPHDQIASVTGISHAAARKRHSRALRALALLLQEDDPR